MEYYLGSLITEIRRRGGLPKPANSSGSAYSPTSDAQIAVYLNEAIQQAASKIVHVTAGYVSTRNAGWFYRQLPLSVDSSGYAKMPLDVGKLVGFRLNSTDRSFLMREGVGDYCSGQFRLEPMRVYFPGRASTTVYIDYNSNLAYSLIQGTVTSSTSTTFTTANASMSYSGELVALDDYYNGLDIKIVAGTGIGQSKRITDYDSASATFTVDSAFGVSLSTDSVFATVLPLPVEAREYFFYETLLRLPMAAESGRYVEAHQRSYMGMLASIHAKEAYQ